MTDGPLDLLTFSTGGGGSPVTFKIVRVVKVTQPDFVGKIFGLRIGKVVVLGSRHG